MNPKPDQASSQLVPVPEEVTGHPRRIVSGPLSWRQTFAALKYRNFRLFFIGQLVSLTGTWMQNTAQSWLVYQLTGSKLLLVLQEGEFQRLGAPASHKVNVRVIAASNHDLAQAVRRGRFREDLYYRLNVFPIQVPPLRERPEDIPLLVLAFMEEFSSRMGKQVAKVPRQVMEALQRHDWPGNIRELRNAIERGIILSSGDTLRLALLRDSVEPRQEPVTLAELEQQHILKTLERTGWRIKGPKGAAQLLGLKPGTLYSRMRKLRVPHRHGVLADDHPSVDGHFENCSRFLASAERQCFRPIGDPVGRVPVAAYG